MSRNSTQITNRWEIFLLLVSQPTTQSDFLAISRALLPRHTLRIAGSLGEARGPAPCNTRIWHDSFGRCSFLCRFEDCQSLPRFPRGHSTGHLAYWLSAIRGMITTHNRPGDCVFRLRSAPSPGPRLTDSIAELFKAQDFGTRLPH